MLSDSELEFYRDSDKKLDAIEGSIRANYAVADIITIDINCVAHRVRDPRTEGELAIESAEPVADTSTQSAEATDAWEIPQAPVACSTRIQAHVKQKQCNTLIMQSANSGTTTVLR